MIETNILYSWFKRDTYFPKKVRNSENYLFICFPRAENDETLYYDHHDTSGSPWKVLDNMDSQYDWWHSEEFEYWMLVEKPSEEE